jgi:hypothetical protein
MRSLSIYDYKSFSLCVGCFSPPWLCVILNSQGGEGVLHILERRSWNCLLKHVIEGKLEGRIEVTEKRDRRHKQLMDDRKKTIGYWKLKKKH